jgi:chemotaxis protein CheZ
MTDGSAPPEGAAHNDELQCSASSLCELEAPACESRKIGSDLASDLASMRHSDIPLAVDQLDAVIQATEHAANQIIDACTALEAAGRDAGGEVAERISRAVTAIYEACSFQDLTGQRIVNVANTLGLIESKLGDITLMVGIFANEIIQEAATSDERRLVGPQRPEEAINQAAVDQLLAHLS